MKSGTFNLEKFIRSALEVRVFFVALKKNCLLCSYEVNIRVFFL